MLAATMMLMAMLTRAISAQLAPTPTAPPSAAACPLDPNGCKWLAPPCETRSAGIPAYEFVKLAPNNTRFAGVNSLEGIKFTAGEMYGGSIMNPAPVLCAFPNTYDGKANSWILAARDSSNPPPTGTTYFKMVEVMLEETPPKAGVRNAVGMSTTRAGYVQQANNQCKSASDLMDAWSNRNPIPATECGIRGFPECNGYGLIGVELSAVTSTAPLPWNTYDVSTAAMPPGKEFAVAGTDRDQTFFYNFCRGTTPHGDNSTSFGFACRGGVSAVCEVTQNTVAKGLAYPCGTVQNVVAQVTKIGLQLSYSNPSDYNNNRNTEVMLECDKFADEPVFYPVVEDPNGGPKYSMQVRTKAGCSTNPPSPPPPASHNCGTVPTDTCCKDCGRNVCTPDVGTSGCYDDGLPCQGCPCGGPGQHHCFHPPAPSI